MSAIITQSVIGSYLNPDVRTIFKGHLQPWMFSEDWAGQFVACIDKPAYDGRVPDIHEFVMDLHSNYGVPSRDCEKVADVFADYSPPKQLDHVITMVQGFIRESHLSQGVSYIAAGVDREQKEKGLSAITYGINFQVGVDSFVDFTDESAIERARIEDLPPGGRIIKSSFSVINNALAYGGYKYGDLVMVCAESGVGKSSWLITEGAHFIRQGLKVAHLVLGDLSTYDMFLKYVSSLNDVYVDEVLQGDYREYMTPEVKECFSRLRTRVLAPDTFDIHQLLAKASQLYQKFEFDVLIVDYDGNIKDTAPSATSSSYVEGGLIYANLKGYAQGRCLAMIASQTKITYWGEELVLKNYANDSSKKQHHLDLMVGLGPNKEHRGVGTMNLPKVRRGVSDRRVRIKFDNGKGIIREITDEEYQRLILQRKEAGNVRFDLESIMKDGQDHVVQ